MPKGNKTLRFSRVYRGLARTRKKRLETVGYPRTAYSAEVKERFATKKGHLYIGQEKKGEQRDA